MAEPNNNQNQQGAGTQQNNPQNNPQNNQQNAGVQNQPAPIDYEKLSSIIMGRQSAAEDTVLKNYFKEQGLSKEEMTQAINAYKQQRDANKPNVEALQNQAAVAQQAMIRSQIENKALLMHQELGVDISTVSYLMKLVNLDGVVDQNGIINDEKLKEAFNKVLEDVPQLKKTEEQHQQGFRQVGAAQQIGGISTPSTQQAAVPTKRWNRFNN